MKNQTVKPLLAIVLLAIALTAAVCALTPLTVGAADQKPMPNVKKSDPAGKSVSSLPFHGKLDSVDPTAKSIKVGDRTFQVMTTTKITKDGAKPGTLDDAKVGEAVAGAFHQGDGGQYQLVSLRLGPKPEKKSAAEKKK